MSRPGGFTRSPLEKTRQSHTMMVRSLDYQTRKHEADMARRHEKIARLTAEIKELEATQPAK